MVGGISKTRMRVGAVVGVEKGKEIKYSCPVQGAKI